MLQHRKQAPIIDRNGQSPVDELLDDPILRSTGDLISQLVGA